jgi:hypothetical protein
MMKEYSGADLKSRVDLFLNQNKMCHFQTELLMRTLVCKLNQAEIHSGSALPERNPIRHIKKIRKNKSSCRFQRGALKPVNNFRSQRNSMANDATARNLKKVTLKTTKLLEEDLFSSVYSGERIVFSSEESMIDSNRDEIKSKLESLNKNPSAFSKKNSKSDSLSFQPQLKEKSLKENEANSYELSDSKRSESSTKNMNKSANCEAKNYIVIQPKIHDDMRAVKSSNRKADNNQMNSKELKKSLTENPNG